MTSGNGSNSSGFTGLPGGTPYGDGPCTNVGNSGDWWPSTEYSSTLAWLCYLLYYDADSTRYSSNETGGSLSVAFGIEGSSEKCLVFSV